MRNGNVLVGTLVEMAIFFVAIGGVLNVMSHLFESPGAQSAGQDSVMTQPIFRVSTLSDGHHLWVQRGLREIATIDIETGIATTYRRGTASSVTEACVSDDGATCLIAFEDQDLSIFRNQQLLVFDSSSEGLFSLFELSATGRIAIRVIGGTSVRGWELEQDSVQQFEFVLMEQADRIALDSPGERMLVSTSAGKHSLYETKTGRLLKSFTTCHLNSAPTADAEFTRDGLGVAVAYGSTVVMYDSDGGDIDWMSKIDNDSLGFQNLTNSIDGRWMAASGVSSGICILNRNTGEIECRFPEMNPFNRIAFSQSCDLLYCGSRDGSIRVFSIAEQREIEPIRTEK